MRHALVTAACLLAHAALAGEFDPTDYIRRHEYEESQKVQAVRQRIVIVNGVMYRRLEAGAGSILVPKLDDLSQSDIERALCAGGSAETPVSERSAMATAAELRVAEKIKIYSSVIVNTIHRRCGEGAPALEPASPLRPDPALDIGVEWDGKGRNPTRYRIFNRNLGPNLGVGADF